MAGVYPTSGLYGGEQSDMKKTGLAALILLASLRLSYAQSLLDLPVNDYAVHQLTLEDALYQLKEQVGVEFSFTNALLPPGRHSLTVPHANLRQTLEILLQNTPLAFRQLGRQVVIYLPRGLTYTLSGILRDSVSGEPLINANVFETLSEKGTVSNEYGYYSITLPAGPIELSCSYIGYAKRTKPLYLQNNQRLDLSLRADLTLQAVEVISDSMLTGTQLTSASGAVVLGLDEIKRLPALAGEPDVVRSLYLLPGVQTGTDGVGGIHVRGGGNGQNLIMLDGVPVYNINHAAGLFSVFNTNAIRSSTFYRGGFPARYGGRLSSVLDIRTKEGNRRALKAEGGIGLLSTRLTVEGPIVKDKSSFIVSARRSLLDFYLQPLTDELGAGGDYDYLFYDINAKFNIECSSRDNLYVSYYRGQDDFFNAGGSQDTLQLMTNGNPEAEDFLSTKDYRYELSWNTQSAVLRWTHLFGDRLFGSMAATFSGLDTKIRYQENDSLQALHPGGETTYLLSMGRYSSRIRDFGLRFDFDFRPSTTYQLRYGAQAVRHEFRPGLLNLQVAQGPIPEEDAFLRNQPRTAAWEYSAYAENIWQLTDEVELNAGLHLAAFRVPGNTYFLPQPRLSASWQWHKDWQLRGYFSRMAQFAHLLYNTATGLPTEMWVPSTREIRPEEAWQLGGALSWSGIKGWKATAEVYGKRMEHLLSYLEGASPLSNWPSSVTSGRGEAVGLELALEKQVGVTRGWMSYSLGRATRQFDGVNNGVPYPFRYDRRHNFTLAALHRFSRRLEVSASYIYSSGIAISLPSGQYDIFLPGLGRIVVVEYGKRNAFRLPAYHRLDLGVNLRFSRPKVEHLLNLGVYNVYNRKNVLYVRTAIDAGGELLRFEPVTFLPILPSLSYSAKF
jgi:hypothetical protein